tara:strand:+ start:147 stop:332 length:186 start_codon:yes stop_codon:yes gene_type:complete
MKVGDTIKVMKMTRWGGFIGSDLIGIVIRKTYEAYDPKLSRWDVLVKGQVINLEKRRLHRI